MTQKLDLLGSPGSVNEWLMMHWGVGEKMIVLETEDTNPDPPIGLVCGRLGAVRRPSVYLRFSLEEAKMVREFLDGAIRELEKD